MKTEATEMGYSLLGEVNEHGTIVLTCVSEAVKKDPSGAMGRGPWHLSILGIPPGTPRGEAERVVSHWLTLYGDENLCGDGRKVLRDLFASLQELAAPAPVSSPPPALN